MTAALHEELRRAEHYANHCFAYGDRVRLRNHCIAELERCRLFSNLPPRSLFEPTEATVIPGSRNRSLSVTPRLRSFSGWTAESLEIIAGKNFNQQR